MESDSSHPKKRKALTDADRLIIRKRNRSHPPAHQKDLALWFKAETGHDVTQGMISRILSSQYAHLDNLDKRKDQNKLESKRHTAGDWPELEAALFEWHQRMDEKKATLTGDVLKAQAAKLWERLPQYASQEAPKWSNGWLGGFKARFGIKEYVTHGEGGAAAIDQPNVVQQMDEVVVQQMDEVRTLCTQYEPQNVLNMDETGLNWKASPNRTLATKSRAGGNKSKDRITLALTSNADGSEQFEAWIIGQSKNPRCFKKINRKALRIHYRYNKSKWMTGLICEEYLRWLNGKMKAEGRKVLLLMDNFSGHELAVQLVGGKQGLSHVRIEWLPPNTTSHWQPMDQGIIASFKLQYRKQWVAYIVRTFEAGKDPNRTVTLLKAIQWSRLAWEQLVTPTTIQKCWWKSTCIKKPVGEEDTQQDIGQDERSDLEEQLAQLPPLAEGEERIPLNEFIDPESEVVVDEDGDIFDTVIEHYSVEDDDVESETEEEEAKIIPTAEGLKALGTVKLWKLQQLSSGEIVTLQALDHIEREMLQVRRVAMKQTSITSFFQYKD